MEKQDFGTDFCTIPSFHLEMIQERRPWKVLDFMVNFGFAEMGCKGAVRHWREYGGLNIQNQGTQWVAVWII
jgi:hypothetical protein